MVLNVNAFLKNTTGLLVIDVSGCITNMLRSYLADFGAIMIKRCDWNLLRATPIWLPLYIADGIVWPHYGKTTDNE